MVALEGIGAALERLRVRKLGKDNYALAHRKTGVDASSLGKYERGTRGMTLHVLERLLDGYGATLQELGAELLRLQGGTPANGDGVQLFVKSEPDAEWLAVAERLSREVETLTSRLAAVEEAARDEGRRRGNGGA